MEKGRKKFKNSNFHFVNLKRDFRNSEYDMEEEKNYLLVVSSGHRLKILSLRTSVDQTTSIIVI